MSELNLAVPSPETTRLSGNDAPDLELRHRA